MIDGQHDAATCIEVDRFGGRRGLAGPGQIRDTWHYWSYRNPTLSHKDPNSFRIAANGKRRADGPNLDAAGRNDKRPGGVFRDGKKRCAPNQSDASPLVRKVDRDFGTCIEFDGGAVGQRLKVRTHDYGNGRKGRLWWRI